MLATLRRAHRANRQPASTWLRRGVLTAALLLTPLLGTAAGPAYAEDQPEWVSITSGLFAQGVSGLCIHPKEPDVYFAHVHGMGAARSKDGGKTWERIMEGVKPTPDPRSPIRISLDPTKPRWLYMVAEGQIYKSTNSGDSWQNITTGALASYSRDRRSTSYLAYEVRVNQGKSVHLVVGTRGTSLHHGGVFESRDGGKTWEQLAGSNLGRSGMGDEGHDTFMVRLDPKTEKNLLAAGRWHVWRSTDRGQSWEMDDPGGEGRHEIRTVTDAHTLKNIYLGDTRGIWEARGVSKKWGKKPIVEGDVLHLTGANKKLYAVFADEGIKLSEGSRHKKWSPAATDGYANAEPHDIVIHPRDRRTTFFVTSEATGIHKTTDSGKTIAPIEGTNVPTIVPGMVHAGVHPAGSRTSLALTEHGVVFGSTDGGQTWSRVGRIGQTPHRIIACPAEDTWYATGRRLLRSKDNGKTWLPFFSPEQPENRVLDVAFAEVDGKATVMALLERSGEVVKTSDDGKSWTKTDAPPFSKGTWASDFAVNPANPAHMVMATRSLRLVWSDQDTDGGVFETMDGGKKWANVSRNLKPTRKESADARRKKSGWNFGRRIVMDPVSGLMLYGADGGGLWARTMPGADGKIENHDWFAVTPKQMPKTTYGVFAYAMSPGADGAEATSRMTLQLFTPGAETSGMVTIDGAGLQAMYDFACPARKKKIEEETGETLAEPGGWQEIKSPGYPIASLDSIPGTVQGLIGTDLEHGKGVLFFGASVKQEAPREAGDAPEKPAGPAKLDPPEGMWGFSASADQDINVWELRSKKRSVPLRGHNAEVYAVRMSQDETVVASGGADRKVHFWDGSQLTALGQVEAPGAVTSLVFDDDSEILYAGCDSWQIVAVQVASKKSLGLLEGSAGAVLCLAVSEETSKLYSGGKDGKIRIWDTQKREELQAIDFGAEVYALAVSPDGGRIYAGGQGNTVRVFDALGAEVAKRELPQTVVMTMRLGPEGKHLFVGGEGGVIVLKAEDLSDVRKHTGPEKAILCLDVSADGIWVFGGDEDNGLWLWQHNIDESVWNNPGAHAGAVFSVALSPDETEAGNSEMEDSGGGEEPPEDAGGK
ncbi:MAG: hypothetical protein QNJ98_03820 [Planctomycetota bacterium]|nr:hypothetical protein [Planctomycetota bacterium]